MCSPALCDLTVATLDVPRADRNLMFGALKPILPRLCAPSSVREDALWATPVVRGCAIESSGAVKNFGCPVATYAPPAGLFGKPFFDGTMASPLSCQIPPGWAFHPKLPRPATQLEEPPPAIAAPSDSFVALGIARRALKLRLPATQLDALLPPSEVFAAGRLTAKPGRHVDAPSKGTDALWRFAAGWVCAAARPVRKIAGSSVTAKTYLRLRPIIVELLSQRTRALHNRKL